MRKFLVSVFLAGALVALLVGPQLALAQSYSSGGGARVALQPTSPGTKQVGNIAIVGKMVISNQAQAAFSNPYINPTTNGFDFVPDPSSPANQPMFRFLHPDTSPAVSVWHQGVAQAQLIVDGCTSTHPCLSVGNGTFWIKTPSFTSSLAQDSGGTGAGALTCPAGQFITSNGTAYSCSAPANASVVVAHVSAAGVVGQQFGSITLSNPAHTSGQGSYNFVITGATPGSIVFVSANSRIGNNPNGTFIEATPTTNQVLVECSNAAGGAADCDFSLDIRKL